MTKEKEPVAHAEPNERFTALYHAHYRQVYAYAVAGNPTSFTAVITPRWSDDGLPEASALR
ncbi:hypothetical protein ACFFMM_12105 [Micromonospora chaiyaphumensis]|uniref:Uncharacterized protein n=1 Tax=Micromonospora chaiyaphumensis TaxID=307119 RepID=A0A1C4WD24_9ACTN|nr:hypothetical protein [Micromonospora chaiyaphumensis]SCE94090.1 hypothetical protein GA0070214_103451 [Micromonospora chaiyaphumensis]